LPPYFTEVKSLRDYQISVKGLDIGKYSYCYEIGDAFFEHFNFRDIKKGNLLLDVQLEKESNLMVFNFSFSGTVELHCDRCLELYNQFLKGDYKLIVKYSNKFEELSDEVISISANLNYFNFGQYIFEFINLMLPLKKVHPEDDNSNNNCDSDMLNKLKEYSNNSSDVSWNNLKNIKLD